MCEICNNKCIYYPTNYSKILKEYYDENGLLHREAVYLCNYDDHRIMTLDKCENYRRLHE